MENKEELSVSSEEAKQIQVDFNLFELSQLLEWLEGIERHSGKPSDAVAVFNALRTKLDRAIRAAKIGDSTDIPRARPIPFAGEDGT